MRKYTVPKNNAIEVKTAQGNMIVRIFSDGTLEVESRQGPSLKITDLYHTERRGKDHAPDGAIYDIDSYVIREDSSVVLNGDVFSVYLSRRGIILDDAGVERVRKLPASRG